MQGEVLALLAALLWGVAPILDKFALKESSLYAANLLRLSGALLVVSLLAPLDFRVSARAAVLLLVAGIIGGAVAMLLYYKALSTSQVAKVVAITATYPMFTALFSAALGEELGLRTVIGIIAIIIGVYLVST
ncbi:MAG: DMT family transporter [Archaeoglobaceae archaeon]